jgi:hypothetical protein
MSPTGQVLAQWDTAGVGGQRLTGPLCFAVDGLGCVYYAENTQASILKFDSNGNLLSQWGSTGLEPGQILWPNAMAADAIGNVFIADVYGKVQKFTSTGSYLATVAGATLGGELGQLRQTQGVAVDEVGNVYISDHFNHRVQRWAPIQSTSSAATAKQSAEGSMVTIADQVITASFDDCFYVESTNRTSGIKVISDAWMPTGIKVTINGYVTTVDGERQILATDVQDLGSATVDPLGLTNASLGGGILGAQSGVWGWVTVRDSNSPNGRKLVWQKVEGLNNIGLLVRVWGTVTQDNEGGYFLDDGSNLHVKIILPPGVAIDSVSKLASITGISTCVKDGEEIKRAIRVRTQEDVISL